ncbi:MAG: FprA family A-type flavoprotein, partial [Pseudomonadota bacterium]
IDTVDSQKAEEFFHNLQETGVSKIDYLVANHAEGDHAGLCQMVLDKFPGCKIICNNQCKGLLQSHYKIEEGHFQVIKDGDTLSLGDKSLEFIFAPWVHWPETMLTYLREQQILFTCDLFGTHLASSDLFPGSSDSEAAHILEETKLYYAQIMMPFRTHIQKHMERISKYPLKMIAPSHGPIFNRPEVVLNAYRDWVSDRVKNEVVIPYISMYGSTEKLVMELTDQLEKNKVTVRPMNLATSDMGQVAKALVDPATIVIGSSMVLNGPHPTVSYALMLANLLKPKARYGAVLGSFGWGGKLSEQIVALIPNLKLEMLDGAICKGHPLPQDLKKIEALAQAITQRHQNLG